MIRHSPALIMLALSVSALAGPLDPPAGPIAPTHKTLTQVEPRTPIGAATTPGDADSTFKITQPGSYYLADNITGASGKRGIEIEADNVTIDLNGFALVGVSGALQAVSISGPRSNLVVKDGTVRGWPGGGVVLLNARACLVTGLAVNNSGGVSIDVGNDSVVQACTVDDTASTDFSTAAVRAGCCTVIDSCSVRGSSGGGDGIIIDNTCTVRNCVVVSTTGVCIRTNGQLNHIEGCIIGGGVGGGIVVAGSCTVRGCTVADCSVAAILVNGGDNRIERNNVRTSLRGILCTGQGNIFFGNSASGNTSNFEINNGNVGLFMTAVTGAAFQGSNGGVSPGSADTNTNYAY